MEHITDNDYDITSLNCYAPTTTPEAQRLAHEATELYDKALQIDDVVKQQQMLTMAESLWSHSIGYYQRLFAIRGNDSLANTGGNA